MKQGELLRGADITGSPPRSPGSYDPACVPTPSRLCQCAPRGLNLFLTGHWGYPALIGKEKYAGLGVLLGRLLGSD